MITWMKQNRIYVALCVVLVVVTFALSSCSYPTGLVNDAKNFSVRHVPVIKRMLQDDHNLEHVLIGDHDVELRKLYRDGLLLDLEAFKVEIDQYNEFLEIK